MVFFALRQKQHTVQALVSVTPEAVSKQMVKWAASVPLESIVLVEGVIKRSPEEIKGATTKDAEVHIKKVREFLGVRRAFMNHLVIDSHNF